MSRSSNRSEPVLCRAIDVWERQGNAAVRIRCFEWLGASKYWVQSSDFYRKDDRAVSRSSLDDQFIELFLEKSIEDVDLFESLEAAIEHHKSLF